MVDYQWIVTKMDILYNKGVYVHAITMNNTFKNKLDIIYKYIYTLYETNELNVLLTLVNALWMKD